MITQTVDPHHFINRARQIKRQIPTILSQWGLIPRFKRWRLAQDPETGMVVLFGVLNNKYIATHATTPFSNYFDPRLLHDLETELHVHVISSANDGLRYAFILERGQVDIEPAHIEYPFQDGNSSFVKTVPNANPIPELIVLKITPAPPIPPESVDNQSLVNQGVKDFLKVFDDIKIKDDATQAQPVQESPDAVLFEVKELRNDSTVEHPSEEDQPH